MLRRSALTINSSFAAAFSAMYLLLGYLFAFRFSNPWWFDYSWFASSEPWRFDDTTVAVAQIFTFPWCFLFPHIAYPDRVVELIHIGVGINAVALYFALAYGERWLEVRRETRAAQTHIYTP